MISLTVIWPANRSQPDHRHTKMEQVGDDREQCCLLAAVLCRRRGKRATDLAIEGSLCPKARQPGRGSKPSGMTFGRTAYLYPRRLRRTRQARRCERLALFGPACIGSLGCLRGQEVQVPVSRRRTPRLPARQPRFRARASLRVRRRNNKAPVLWPWKPSIEFCGGPAGPSVFRFDAWVWSVWKKSSATADGWGVCFRQRYVSARNG